MSKATLTGLLVATAAVAIALAVWRSDRPEPVPEVSARTRTGEQTIAFTGDTVVTSRMPVLETDPGFARVVETVRGASLAVTNLELTLFEHPPSGDRAPGAWPIGARAEAEELKRLGFDVITRANNRAGDYGVDGLRQTGAVLDAVGLRDAGVGDDLGQARSALLVGTPVQKVALISVSVSSSPEARATHTRGEIKGRPGVNPLRFTANITVDQKTFETLKASAPALQPDAQTGDAELTLFGRTITRGDRTVIDFAVDRADQEEILEQIAAARRSADIVLLALHSHEPSNQSEQPADFVRRFAQAAIDRGATIVVGHGPHQLRGVEVYGGGVIFHSLGNFLFPFEPLASRDADVFDGGVDLYALALGAVGEQGRRTPSPIDAAAWWESVVAVATFKDGAVTGVRLHPLDLGVELSQERRGTPRAAAPSRSAVILERLARLSAAFGTRISIDGDTGMIDVGGARAGAR